MGMERGMVTGTYSSRMFPFGVFCFILMWILYLGRREIL